VTKSLPATSKKQPAKKYVLVESARPRDFIQTVGRRKRAIARLRFYASGTGAITINGPDYKKYFPYVFWQEIITEPLPLVGLANSVDVSVKIGGGGLSAQADAIRLALARALVKHNPDWRPTLRKMGWLTRDPREKERKKPGLKRARRAPQWQKR
jgi:small subunit ribosomal protein S9